MNYLKLALSVTTLIAFTAQTASAANCKLPDAKKTVRKYEDGSFIRIQRKKAKLFTHEGQIKIYIQRYRVSGIDYEGEYVPDDIEDYSDGSYSFGRRKFYACKKGSRASTPLLTSRAGANIFKIKDPSGKKKYFQIAGNYAAYATHVNYADSEKGGSSSVDRSYLFIIDLSTGKKRRLSIPGQDKSVDTDYVFDGRLAQQLLLKDDGSALVLDDKGYLNFFSKDNSLLVLGRSKPARLTSKLSLSASKTDTTAYTIKWSDRAGEHSLTTTDLAGLKTAGCLKSDALVVTPKFTISPETSTPSVCFADGTVKKAADIDQTCSYENSVSSPFDKVDTFADKGLIVYNCYDSIDKTSHLKLWSYETNSITTASDLATGYTCADPWISEDARYIGWGETKDDSCQFLVAPTDGSKTTQQITSEKIHTNDKEWKSFYITKVTSTAVEYSTLTN